MNKPSLTLAKQFKKEIKEGRDLEKQYTMESDTQFKHGYNTHTNALPMSSGSFLSTDIPLDSSEVNPIFGDIDLMRKPIYEELLKELRMKQLLKEIP